jgi:hypothetical protein
MENPTARDLATRSSEIHTEMKAKLRESLKHHANTNNFLCFWAGCYECNNFLKLFVKTRLAISFAGVQISYFSDLQIKSYGCLKFLGRVRAAKKLFIF